jgi:cysteine-rich repeat protein
MNWLQPDEIAVDTDTLGGSWTLSELYTPGLKQVRIPVDQNAFYFAEYRAGEGFDLPPPGYPAEVPGTSQGVYLWMNHNTALNGDADTRSVRPQNLWPRPMQPGEFFCDSYRRVNVRVNSFSADGRTASIDVVRGACLNRCGDGITRNGEACDDGNTASGDGCSATCTLEPGFTCTTDADAHTTCVNNCGNGVIDAGEACDDGNTASGDGCSSACFIERPYRCTTDASGRSVCTNTCGDGVVQSYEACDDGNTVNGDGCTLVCTVQKGWTCTPGSDGRSVCIHTCGNGIVDPNEQCDDGNNLGFDGCYPPSNAVSACNIEYGWTCSGSPSVCVMK